MLPDANNTRLIFGLPFGSPSSFYAWIIYYF